MSPAERSLSNLVAIHGIVQAGKLARGMQAKRPSAIGAARVAILNDETKLREFISRHNERLFNEQVR